MSVFELIERGGPLVVSMPHSGLELSPGLRDRLVPEALALPDTDWHIPQLYDFLASFNATVICANYSRYVVDLNRDPSGQSLYPGQATTGLVPTEFFDGAPLYQPGETPGHDEIEARRATWFDPYHIALRAQIERVKAQHGFAVLWDAHSIASEVPRLFDGRLHDLNLGTNSGASCAPEVEAAATAALAGQTGFRAVTNGRFKGGWITRHYGEPDANIHALQMEIAQIAYMSEGAPYAFDDSKAARLRPVLQSVIHEAVEAASRRHG